MTHNPNPPGGNVWVRSNRPTWPAGGTAPGRRSAQPEGHGERQVWRPADGPVRPPTVLADPVPSAGNGSSAGRQAPRARTFHLLIMLAIMLLALAVLLASFAMWERPVTTHTSSPPSIGIEQT